MGSIFTRYKTPGWISQDYTVTFTPELMRKDMDPGLALGSDGLRMRYRQTAPALAVLVGVQP